MQAVETLRLARPQLITPRMRVIEYAADFRFHH